MTLPGIEEVNVGVHMYGMREEQNKPEHVPEQGEYCSHVRANAAETPVFDRASTAHTVKAGTTNPKSICAGHESWISYHHDIRAK